MSRPTPLHSRQGSAVSTTSVIRSSSHSPSPSASPISPTGDGAGGLSRRLSWGRPREDVDVRETLDVPFVGSAAASSGGLSVGTTYPPPPARPPPVEEYDIGLGGHRRSSDGAQKISSSPDSGRPYFSQYPAQSQASLESSASDADTPPETDGERLTFAPPAHGAAHHRRIPSRAYDEQGNPREASMASKVSGVVRRNPTFRNVSRTSRQASARSSGMMGSEDSKGMTRSDGGDSETEQVEGSGEASVDQGEEAAQSRPGPRPPEAMRSRLRGRTSGLFGPDSRTRRLMDQVSSFPWTEPAILALIIVNVVVSVIQAAAPLNEPRVDDEYFHSWTDFASLGLFIVFTSEMFARIIVTGLIIDPEVSLRATLFGPNGIIEWLSHRLRLNRSGLHRSTSRFASTEPTWKSDASARPSVPAPKKKATLVAESPFQQAVGRQHSLSAQGRPYSRHSWHRVDMIAVIAFWITFFLALVGKEATADRHLYIFRASSVLRAGRLLVVTNGTTTILHSSKKAGPLLIRVSFFLVFALALFSIIGVQSFQGSFRRQCVYTDPLNRTNTIELGQACGGHMSEALTRAPYILLDGSPSNISPKGYICPSNQICETSPENPNDNSQSFDNIFAALVQVIVVTSSNGWAPIMYLSTDSDFFASASYYIVAVIILNFWLVNSLTAVVVNTFKDIRAETQHSAFGADESGPVTEPQWSTEKTKRAMGKLLVLYEKTELFWAASASADSVAQGTRSDSSSQAASNVSKNLELAFTFAFDLEIIIRLIGHYPDYRSFFARFRNSFDSFLAVSTTIIQIPAIRSSTVYPWLTILQLLRWYRVISAFPRMRPLITTVFGSYRGSINMVIFLFLIHLLGASVAVQSFRGDLEADITMSFSQTYIAFLGMYQIFSSENWTESLYNVMGAERPWKQQWLAAIYFCCWFLFANAVVSQMFIAVINENFAVAEESKRKRQVEEFIRKTEPSSAHISWIDRLNPYRLMKAGRNAVKVNTLPPNLVLPSKQNVGPDVGASPDSNEKKGSSTKAAIQRSLGRGDDVETIPLKRLRSRPRSSRMEESSEEADDDRGLSDSLPPLNAGPSADEHSDALREKRNQQADFIMAHPSFDKSSWIFKQSNPVRKFCQSCVDPAYGERIFGRPAHPISRLVMKAVVFCVIVASITVAGIATPEYRMAYYAEHGLARGTWFDSVEVALGTTFVLEASVKIVADGFIFAPNAYLLSLWNVLDFSMLVALLVNTTTSLIYIGGLSRVTRALKAFRALRLITLFDRLRDTLHAVLFAGALKILDASVSMILYLIPFAVWGSNIFSGLSYSCNDGESSGKANCINEYYASPVDNSSPYLVPRVWANPTLDASKWSFDSFRDAILISFEIVSLEGWVDVMSSGMAITGRDQQPNTNASQWNAIYFVLFNLFGGVIILASFLSVIIGNFSSRSSLTTEQRHWVDSRKYIKAQTPSQSPKHRPQSGLRAWCYERATQKHGYWQRGFTWIYYFHILVSMTENFSNKVLTEVQADWIFLLLTVFYALDLIVRFYGLGFNSFRANGWNIFDVIVVTGSFTTTIAALQSDYKGLAGSSVNVQLQKSFLVAIAFKLVQRIDSLNQLFKTSVASLPAIGNLFLLWGALFSFFAILFIEVFGLTKSGNNAESRFQNYYSFGNALLMLAFMSTGEGWNGYMHDYTIAYPRCTESDNYFTSDCGSSAWSYGLFISWNIISMYIFLNMFTGVVVESFAYVYQMPGGAQSNREDMRAFKKLWAEFDTRRTGYIQRKDFTRFFSRSSGVFEVRIYPAEYSLPLSLRHSIPDPVANSSGKLSVVTGTKRAVDVRKMEHLISQIDFAKVRERRQLFSKLFHEARLSEEPGRGISFTAMLLMSAHNKSIDDEKALMSDDSLVRREKTERVKDLVDLDRVRGSLRTVYWRRRFLASREEKRRTLNAEAEGIPAIVLEPMPATPPMDDDPNPFAEVDLAPSPSPPSSRSGTPSHSPEALGAAAFGRSPESRTSGALAGGFRHSPSLSVSTVGAGRFSSRRGSDISMLSEDDALNRLDSPADEPASPGGEDYLESMATSVWGDMMREAVDKEEE